MKRFIGVWPPILFFARILNFPFSISMLRSLLYIFLIYKLIDCTGQNCTHFKINLFSLFTINNFYRWQGYECDQIWFISASRVNNPNNRPHYSWNLCSFDLSTLSHFIAGGRDHRFYMNFGKAAKLRIMCWMDPQFVHTGFSWIAI